MTSTSLKSRYWTFSVKPSNINIQELITKVTQYDYAYIIHDKDINPDTGELKDLHYHFIVRFQNPRYLHPVAEEFNLPDNQLQKVHKPKKMFAYLVHANQPDKYQYSEDEVHTNLDYKAIIADTSDPQQILKDLQGLRYGRMTVADFVQKYKYEMTGGIYQQVKFLTMLLDQSCKDVDPEKLTRGNA